MRFIPTPRPTYLRRHPLPTGLSFSVLALTPYKKYRNINLFPIGFAFRLYLRGRLTLPGLSLDRNPWAFGGRYFHPPYRYSCQHSHFQPLQYTLPVYLHRCWNAPLPLLSKSTASVIYLAPLYLRRRTSRSVSYYAFFKGWLLLSQPPDC